MRLPTAKRAMWLRSRRNMFQRRLVQSDFKAAGARLFEIQSARVRRHFRIVNYGLDMDWEEERLNYLLSK